MSDNRFDPTEEIEPSEEERTASPEEGSIQASETENTEITVESLLADLEVDSADDDIEIDLGDDASLAEPDLDLNLDFGDADTDTFHDEDIDLDLDPGSAQPVLTGENILAEDEDAPPGESADELAEKALEELRAELRAKPGEWYVVHTYSGMEKRVKQNLESRAQSLNMEDYIFEVRVPTEEATEIRNGNKKTVTRTVLPGYVLVCMDLTDESWATVRHTPSVTGFVGHATQPVPLSLDEVEKMLAPAVIASATAKAEGTSRQARRRKIEVADFSEGDSVLITDGPFAGVHASITEINANSQRLKALVDFMGRETPVDLTFAQVEKV